MMLTPADKTFSVEYTIDTFDVMLGLIGGFYGLIVSMFGFCISGYQDFNKENDLIRQFYSTEKEVMLNRIGEPPKRSNDGSEYDQIKAELMARTQYEYTF
jgi:hypothetical protein